MLRMLVALCLSLSVAGGAAAGQIDIEDPWIRAAPPTARMLAGYAVLHNRGSDPVVLVGARSDRFGMVEVHETVEVDGFARMREVPRIEIAPGAAVTLEPGGKHLMLMRPQSVPAEGETVEIVLRLEDGSELTVDFAVRRAGAPSAGGEDHAGH